MFQQDTSLGIWRVEDLKHIDTEVKLDRKIDWKVVSEDKFSLSSMHVDMPPQRAWEEVEDSARTNPVTQEA